MSKKIAVLIPLFIFLLTAVTLNAQPNKPTTEPPNPVPIAPPELDMGGTMRRYIVQLDKRPFAVLPRHRAAAAQEGQIAVQQAQLLDKMSAAFQRPIAPVFQYMAAYNGMALELTAVEAAALARMDGVLSVRAEQIYEIASDAGPAWIGATAVWDGSAPISGIGTQGEGILIGVIDTGINTDHPSFSAEGGDGYVHENPLGAGNYLGLCDGDPAAGCNDKLIGLWDFANDGAEDDGAEDNHGHGSHTASTAAGNVITATVYTPSGYILRRGISGVAPHANLIAYDACVEGQCPGAMALAAVNQAVLDGVDVINYSITGGQNPYQDDLELAFLAANEAGVIVVAAAGNAGANGAVSHQSGWVTAVGAASHNRQMVSSLINFSGGAMPLDDMYGQSLTTASSHRPIVYAGDYGDPFCDAPFAPGTWTEAELVVCDRGGSSGRTQKGGHVLQGGAGAMALVNGVEHGEDLELDAHTLPAVHIGYEDGVRLKNWLASGANHRAEIGETTAVIDDSSGDRLAAFSGRGPTGINLIKPDIVAPGVDVLAALHNGAALIPPEYGFLSGTSMATPHVAGAAALLKAVKPSWSPDEIRSALALTAVALPGYNDNMPANAGSGRVDIARAVRAGLILDETASNYQAANPEIGGDVGALNLPSLINDDCFQTCVWTRTVHGGLSELIDWTASGMGSAGMALTIEPETFSIAPGGAQAITITADLTQFSGEWAVGAILFTSPYQEPLHMPVSARKALGTNTAVLQKSAPDIVRPGEIVTYTIDLNNGLGVTTTASLTDTLPAGLEYVPGSATGGLSYITATRQLVWQGELPPITIDYQASVLSATVPYLNLEGLVNGYCSDLGICDEGSALIDLAASYSAAFTFYGEPITEIYLSANGLAYGPAGWLGTACAGCPQPLPSAAEINQAIAGLWRDIDMSGGNGDWFAAVLPAGWSSGMPRMLYINWHDAGQFGDPSVTSRHAIGLVLDGEEDVDGRIYYIYDNIMNPAQLESYGYVIGAENRDGARGLTYAFAPCTGGSCIDDDPVGALPANGTALRLDPIVTGGAPQRFTYQARATGAVRGLVTNLVEGNGETAVADLFVGYPLFLPVTVR